MLRLERKLEQVEKKIAKKQAEIKALKRFKRAIMTVLKRGKELSGNKSETISETTPEATPKTNP